MKRNDANELQIRTAAWREVRTALAWAFRAVPSASRSAQIEATTDDLESMRVPLESLVVACRGKNVVGALFAQVHAGRSAVLWPPGAAPDEPADTAEQLLAVCLDRLATESVRIVQVVMEIVSPEDAALLESHGFAFLADLLYLGCEESAMPASRPEGPLEFEPCWPDQRERLGRIVEATYEQTLDCPGLDNVRSVEDVLEGYRATGTFHPDSWLIVRNAEEDVGALLLADYPRQGNVELIYMGLVPTVRGRGWGRYLVREAQCHARQLGRPRVVLAVDATNRPAIDMYRACGFEAWERRRVYAKVLPEREVP